MEKILAGIGAAVLFVALLFLVAAMMAYPLKWTWNYIIPSLFGLRQIGALEAFCLHFVAGSLIKASTSGGK